MIFETSLRWSCEDIFIQGLCSTNTNARGSVYFGNFNTNGILETPLQCPQCGCGAKGAANLNDLCTDLCTEEKTGSRKISDIANIMLSQSE